MVYGHAHPGRRSTARRERLRGDLRAVRLRFGRVLRGAAAAWVLAEHEGVTLGYAYGSRHRDRSAYRWAADVAVYIAADHHRAGVGRALYTHLFAQLRAIGLWTLCAGITLPNDASNGLHRALGFVPVGTYRRIGWKAGAWHDVQWWQLDLHPGEPGPPEELQQAVT